MWTDPCWQVGDVTSLRVPCYERGIASGTPTAHIGPLRGKAPPVPRHWCGRFPSLGKDRSLRPSSMIFKQAKLREDPHVYSAPQGPNLPPAATTCPQTIMSEIVVGIASSDIMTATSIPSKETLSARKHIKPGKDSHANFNAGRCHDSWGPGQRPRSRLYRR